MSDKVVADAAEMRIDAIAGVLPELGAELLELQRGELEVGLKSTDVDLVTKADYVSERRLLGCIREWFPEDAVLSEEAGGASEAPGAEERYRWVVDPIDGTVNYANRLPGWAISVGILHGDRRVAALVAGPGTGETFRAVRGRGATRNGCAVGVNGLDALKSGLVVTGFPYDRAERAEPLTRALANFLREAGGVRRLGAAALDFCYVADGRFVGYYETGLKAWDLAAGSLIAEEAGATVTDLRGERLALFGGNGVAVSNGRVHGALLRAAAPLLETG